MHYAVSSRVDASKWNRPVDKPCEEEYGVRSWNEDNDKGILTEHDTQEGEQLVMRNRFRFVWACLCFRLILELMFSGCNPAEATPQPFRKQRQTGLVFVQEKGMQHSQPSLAVFEFGAVDSVTSPRIEHIFTLRNDGDTSLTIDRLQPSCECVSAQFLPTDGVIKKTLAPGMQIQMRVSIDLTRQQPGIFQKFVWTYIQGQKLPIASIETRARLRRLIDFRPSSVEFGLAPAGQTSSKQLTVVMDSGMVGSGTPPVLVSGNPKIQVVLLSSDPTATLLGKKALACTYQITLAQDTPVGVLHGSVYLVRETAGKAAPQHHKPTFEDEPEEALSGVSAPIRGAVMGEVGAIPWAIVFGSVVAGQSAVQQITLIGANESALNGLVMTTTNPFLRLHLRKPEAGEKLTGSEIYTSSTTSEGKPIRALKVLQATLSIHTPPGAVKAEVKLVTHHGEHLVIPVYYDVLK